MKPRLKKNQVRIEGFGIATITTPNKHKPWVDIYDNDLCLVSISYEEMNALIKKWVKASGGYPV